ncbi:MAG: phosphoribosylglycinamide synthetase [Pacificimonas sp.]
MTAGDIPELARVDLRHRRDIRIMLLAKHALADGRPHPEDGNHAVYHQELRQTLERLGFPLVAANEYDALYQRPNADFVIPLLNRGGFQNSEMLAPLLLEKYGLPFLGARAILRGLADDKQAAKLVAKEAGIPTIAGQVYRRGGPVRPPEFGAERMIVKPNASSASWGLKICRYWADAEPQIRKLQDDGHDVIVERWMPDSDIGVGVVGGADGRPVVLPPLRYCLPDGIEYRSYAGKRGLPGEDAVADDHRPITAPTLRRELEEMSLRLADEFWPFDYGRFEFRHDRRTGALHFMEVNLSCNLWSRKTIAKAAGLVGIDYPRLIEGIIGHSLARQTDIVPERIAA